MIFDIQPWKLVHIFNRVAYRFKQEQPLPEYVTRISMGVEVYENKLRELWEDFKKDPTSQNARDLAEFMKQHSEEIWREQILEILGVDELTQEQEDLLQEELSQHHHYIDNSLLPDLLRAIEQGLEDFSNLDYRVIFLYAGALWSFGFLITVTFDGLSPRDAGDVFMFAGPNDSGTCEGDRGCKQYVGKVYTAAEILIRNIIPGRLKCLTSCRHMLLPVASFPEK